MIKQILIQLWNQKRKYIAVILEQVFVFIVLMICVVSLFQVTSKYRSPGMLNSENTVYIGYMLHDGFTQHNMSHIGNTMDLIVARLKDRPYVEAICESIQFIPYLRPSEYFWGDSLTLSSGTKIFAHTKATDTYAETVFQPEIIQGRWFHDGERPNGLYPAVVTAQFAEKSQIDNPLEKIFNIGPQAYEITGVIAGLKESAFEQSLPSVIVPISSWQRISFYREYAARVKPGYEDEFYNDYFNEFESMGEFSQYVEPILSSMDRWKADTMTKTISEISLITIPTVFLVIFAFLGTLGLNLVELKSRTKEFALRRAVGSTRSRIMTFIIMQNLIISSIALVPGLILALLVYELNWMTVTAIVATVAIVLIFSISSTLYPASVIAKVNPAKSLKYE